MSSEPSSAHRDFTRQLYAQENAPKLATPKPLATKPRKAPVMVKEKEAPKAHRPAAPVKAPAKARPLAGSALSQPRLHRLLSQDKQPIDACSQRIQRAHKAHQFEALPLPRRFHGFEEALAFCRELHPLPQEMQMSQKPEHHTWLMARIGRCEDAKQLKHLAFSLDEKDLSTLFPSLARLKRGEAIDRLISVILMRASHYLYIQGWMTLQYAYPRSTVQKGLSELCEVLENQEGKARQPTALFPLGDERFDWSSILRISEITLPRNRHFLRNIIKYIKDHELTGEVFFQRFGIYRELPLGLAIRSHWDMAMFENHVEKLYHQKRLFQTR